MLSMLKITHYTVSTVTGCTPFVFHTRDQYQDLSCPWMSFPFPFWPRWKLTVSVKTSCCHHEQCRLRSRISGVTGGGECTCECPKQQINELVACTEERENKASRRILLSFATCTCSAQRGIIMTRLSSRISDCSRQWIGGCQSNGLMCEVNPKVNKSALI